MFKPATYTIEETCNNCKYANEYIPIFAWRHTNPRCSIHHRTIDPKSKCENFTQVGDMNDKELVAAMIEIIISKQPLACTTSQIRDDLYRKYNRYYYRNDKIIRLLKRESENNSALTCSKGGRDIYWRYNKEDAQ